MGGQKDKPHVETKSKAKRFYVCNDKEVTFSCTVPTIGLVKVKPGLNEFPSEEIANKVLETLNKTFEGVHARVTNGS